MFEREEIMCTCVHGAVTCRIRVFPLLDLGIMRIANAYLAQIICQALFKGFLYI